MLLEPMRGVNRGTAGVLCGLLLMLANLPAEASTASQILRTKAQLAYAEKAFQQALAWSEQAVAEDESDLMARYYRGISHARLRHYSQAEAELEAVMAAGGRFPGLPYELGMAAFHAENYPRAAAALQLALDERQQHHRAAYYLGISHYRMGEYEEALAPLQLAAEKGGGMAVAALYLKAEALYQLERREEGREVLIEVRKLEQGNRLFDYYLYPYSSIWHGDDVEETRSRALFSAAAMERGTAEHLLDESLAADPGDAYSRYYRGVLMSRGGDYAAAERELAAAAEAGAAHKELHHELGYAAYRQGKYEAAEVELRQGLEQNPDHDRSHYYLGRSLLHQERYEEALAQLQQVDDAGSLGAAAGYARADILATLHRFSEARDELKQLLEHHTDSAYADRARQLDERLAGRSGILKGMEVELTLGAVHDSNVALYSDDLPLPSTLSDRGDNRWQLGLDLKWSPSPVSAIPVSIGYQLFQSYHQELEDYDLRNHALSVEWQREIEQGEWGVGYQFVKASLSDYDYVESHVLSPFMLYQHGEERLSFIKFQWRSDTYAYPAMDGYDGSRYELNYRHLWLRGDERYFALGGVLGSDQSKDDTLASLKYGINGLAQWKWQKLQGDLSLEYMRRDFADSAADRRDTSIKLGARLRYPLLRRTELEASLMYLDNASNQAAFDYARQVYGLNVKWRPW